MTEAQTQENTVTTISLADICKELSIKPQAARVKLRKKLAAAKGAGFRWAFTEDQVDEVKAILTVKAEKKAEDGDKDGEDDE